MKSKLVALLGLAVLVAALAVPSSAQTITLKANIPFQFVVNGRTMPAGEYLLQNSGTNVMKLQDRADNASVLSLTMSSGILDKGNREEAKLIFNRYGDKYFLSDIWDGYLNAGFVLPRSHAERELSRTVSFNTHDAVTVLARL